MHTQLDDTYPSPEQDAADNRFVRRAGFVVVVIQLILVVATVLLTRM